MVTRRHDGRTVMQLGRPATWEDLERVRAEPFDAVELELTPLWEDAGVPDVSAEE